MNGQILIDYDAIPQATRKWLEDNRVKWFKQPQVCYLPYRETNGSIQFMHYSIDYLTSTPLEVIKQKWKHYLEIMHDNTGEEINESNQIPPC